MILVSPSSPSTFWYLSSPSCSNYGKSYTHLYRLFLHIFLNFLDQLCRHHHFPLISRELENVSVFFILGHSDYCNNTAINNWEQVISGHRMRNKKRNRTKAKEKECKFQQVECNKLCFVMARFARFQFSDCLIYTSTQATKVLCRLAHILNVYFRALAYVIPHVSDAGLKVSIHLRVVASFKRKKYPIYVIYFEKNICT